LLVGEYQSSSRRTSSREVMRDVERGRGRFKQLDSRQVEQLLDEFLRSAIEAHRIIHVRKSPPRL
jgi:hypothetical protein